MREFLAAFIIPIITFCLGVFVYRNSIPKVSIETLTKRTNFYNGMNVQIETYAQLEFIDEKVLYLGEPFEKYEAWTYLHTEESSINLDNLRNQLKENLSKKHFKRVKVLVKGTIQNNCNKGATCCFGESITIKAQEVTQLEPFEDYNLPD
jgi:hypothetical protein